MHETSCKEQVCQPTALPRWTFICHSERTGLVEQRPVLVTNRWQVCQQRTQPKKFTTSCSPTLDRASHCSRGLRLCSVFSFHLFGCQLASRRSSVPVQIHLRLWSVQQLVRLRRSPFQQNWCLCMWIYKSGEMSQKLPCQREIKWTWHVTNHCAVHEQDGRHQEIWQR